MTAASLCRLLAFFVPLAACLAWFQHLARFYSALPSRFPVHFTLTGQLNGWMTPRAFAAFTSVLLLIVLAAVASSLSALPAALFAHPLPPPSSAATSLSAAVAVGAFFEVSRLARTLHTRLNLARILLWPATLLALQITLNAITLRS